jgi:hypothetical protein
MAKAVEHKPQTVGHKLCPTAWAYVRQHLAIGHKGSEIVVCPTAALDIGYLRRLRQAVGHNACQPF